MKKTEKIITELTVIPGVGKSIARDLIKVGIKHIDDLKGKDPKKLYDKFNKIAGRVQDKCLFYVFRCAVYYAETPKSKLDSKKLKWWSWKDQ